MSHNAQHSSKASQQRSEKQASDKAKPLANPNKEFGEGNYQATRDYNQATERFVKSGKVESAARDARPANEQEAHEMERAESIGRSKSKKAKGAQPKDGKQESA